MQIFNTNTKHVIPIGISTNKAKAEIETQPVTVKNKIGECSI